MYLRVPYECIIDGVCAYASVCLILGYLSECMHVRAFTCVCVSILNIWSLIALEWLFIQILISSHGSHDQLTLSRRLSSHKIFSNKQNERKIGKVWHMIITGWRQNHTYPKRCAFLWRHYFNFHDGNESCAIVKDAQCNRFLPWALNGTLAWRLLSYLHFVFHFSHIYLFIFYVRF